MKKAVALLLITTALVLQACRKDLFTEDSTAQLAFSTDSILYDTVFTTVGSVTKSFKVYNNHNRSIKISSLKVAGGVSSNFRINVDGVPLVSTGDIEIKKHDSIYVFIEVTVNPNSQNNPLVIRDSVMFETNGNQQSVTLEAWGQDAYFHVNEYLICNDVWMNNKPHVIYGLVIISAGCSLTIQPGTKVHLHKGAVLAADDGATLIVNGTSANKVRFMGDRLEPDYDEVPGQWGAIWLSPLSVNNKIDWAIIKNGTIGILCDSFPTSPNPTLHMNNTVIKNMSAIGIYARDSKIRATNCVVGNCGQHLVALTIGGQYSFYHCTFANYWNYGTPKRSTPAVIVNNWYETATGTVVRNLDSAHFFNCIIYGELADEIVLDSKTGGNFAYKLHYSVLKTQLNTSNPADYLNCVINSDPEFVDISENNYNISSSSSAKKKGDNAIGLQVIYDLNTTLRVSDAEPLPDAGAYQIAN